MKICIYLNEICYLFNIRLQIFERFKTYNKILEDKGLDFVFFFFDIWRKIKMFFYEDLYLS